MGGLLPHEEEALILIADTLLNPGSWLRVVQALAGIGSHKEFLVHFFVNANEDYLCIHASLLQGLLHQWDLLVLNFGLLPLADTFPK